MNLSPREVEKIMEPQAVVEGAGVRLRRSIGARALDYLDPFLLLDHFAASDASDYAAGFPLHPHRGIETVTYVLAGVVKHKDTLGNAGSIDAGDVQWMTAGRGIMHEEMPQVRPEGIAGFQLWVNLPAQLKMTPPRYQEIRAAEIPVIQREDGATIRVITGRVDGIRGPVNGIAADPTYLDVTIPAGAAFRHPIAQGHTVFAYIFEGAAKFSPGSKRIESPRLVSWGAGDCVEIVTAGGPARFLLVSAAPLREPVARYGPFVMNTQAEIEQALSDLRRGTFV